MNLGNLVWLFREHREAVARADAADHEASILAERNLRLLEDNKKLSDTCLQFQQYVQSNPSHIAGMMDVFNRYQETVLSEVPFIDGKIPEDFWLSPESVFPVKDLNEGS